MKTTLVFATALLMVTARDANAQWEVGPILSGETRAEPSARAGATIRFNWTVQGPIDYVPMPTRQSRRARRPQPTQPLKDGPAVEKQL